MPIDAHGSQPIATTLSAPGYATARNMRRRSLSRLVAARTTVLAMMGGSAMLTGRAADGVSDATAGMERFTPVMPLPDAQSIERFERGRALRQQIWQIAPRKDAPHDGHVRPLFNRCDTFAPSSMNCPPGTRSSERHET
jgi:hypothetical protein